MLEDTPELSNVTWAHGGCCRRRKEWARKLDVQGRMFWYRADIQTPQGGGEVVRPTTGKVVRFIKNCMRTVTPPPSAHGNDDPAGEIVETAKVFSDVVPMEIVASSEVDAAARSTGEALESIDRRREVVHLASKDFPTKYAHFVVNSAALLVPAEVEFLKLSVHRDYVLEESIEHLGCIEEKYIRSVLRINFLEENGVDAGGLQREWFMMLNDLLLDPTAGLFKCTNQEDQAFYLNPNSRQDNGEDHLIYYYATGRLIGRALLEGTVLNFHLCAPLLKLILGVPVTFDDLESFDPELFKSMSWLLENDGVEALQLDFSVTEKRGDTPVVVDLIPGGRDVAVTDANKLQYVQSRVEYHLLTSVSCQLYVFLRGIYEVIPQELLMVFDAEELEYMLCGSPEIDVRDWEEHSVTSPTILHTPTLVWFWEIVREMPNAYRRRLLQFATGCSRVPLVGFKGLTSYDGRVCQFSLKGMPKAAHPCVRSYACFNRLDLPLGTTREQLKDMLYATLDTELYGFTTS